MMVLVSYDVKTSDVGGNKRLRKVSKECQNYGIRVQNSVFECVLDPRDFELLKSKLLKIIDKEGDSLRIYYLGSNWKSKVEHFGGKKAIEIDEPIIL